MSAFDTIESISTIKKGASTASLTITRRADGSFTFVDVDSKNVIIHADANDQFDRLYRAIDALV